MSTDIDCIFQLILKKKKTETIVYNFVDSFYHIF